MSNANEIIHVKSITYKIILTLKSWDRLPWDVTWQSSEECHGRKFHSPNNYHVNKTVRFHIIPQK